MRTEVTEEQIREVLGVYFLLFPTTDPYGEEVNINRVVDYFYKRQ